MSRVPSLACTQLESRPGCVVRAVAPTTDSDALAWLDRIANDNATPADRLRLCEALQAMRRDAGTGPSLERRLRLPATAKKWRDAERDRSLNKAALQLDQAECFAELCRSLSVAWNRFVSRGLWSSWRDDDEPPIDASPLNTALFHATKFNARTTLSARQLERVLDHHQLAKKCRSIVPTL